MRTTGTQWTTILLFVAVACLVLMNHIVPVLQHRSNDSKNQFEYESIPNRTTTTQLPSSHTAEQADEAFELLSPDAQKKLAPLKDVLHDRRELLGKLREMPLDQSIAVFELLRMIDEGPEDFFADLPLKLRNELDRQISQGYMERLDRTAPTTGMRQRIERSHAGGHSSLLGKVFGQDIVSLESSSGVSRSNGLKPLPAELLAPGSKSYIIANMDETKRFYSETVFGGSLLIDEKSAFDHGVYHSNVTISGNEALLVSILYSNNQWTTCLFAFDGSTAYSVYLDGRLKGKNLVDFSHSMKRMIEHSAS
ncbi:MAG: hypothetical protein OXG24_04765 [Gammaproteobacteria bacterium]|nr:hypothetical protein [Gammaproteobacteria bacterium]